MDSVFGMFFWALAIIAFGACIGAGLRGRPGRLFGLTILKIGLAGFFVMLLFVDSFPHNEIILWLLLMLMAGAFVCFGGARGQPRNRQWPNRRQARPPQWPCPSQSGAW